MRNFLIIVAGVLVVNAIVLYSGGFDYVRDKFEPSIPVEKVKPEVVIAFRTALEAKVKNEQGMPIEGFEPYMFLAAFPGLAESDFDGVEASIGKYVLVDGKLEHQLGDARLVHSAAKAITQKGMDTLYHNVAARAGIDLSHATLTDVMSIITTR